MGTLQIIKASAGSGKTYRLTLDYIRNLIINPENYRSILAVTFTNKATSEMKERILKELRALGSHVEGGGNSFYEEFVKDPAIDNSTIIPNARRALSYILHDYSLFSVFTIDKFFQKILRAFVKELGLEGGYAIKFDSDYITQMAIDRLIESSRNDKELFKMLEGMIMESASNQKSSDIRRPLLALSKVLSSENFEKHDAAIAQYYEAIREVNNATTNEITAKATSILKLLTSFSLTPELLPNKSKGFWADLHKIILGKITYGKNTSKTASGESKWAKGVDVSIQDQIVEQLYQLISMIDSTQVLRNSADAVLKESRSFILLDRIGEEIDEINRESGALMLSRSMAILSKLINENDTPFIYEKVGNVYSRFMIDEFQDTSTNQWQNFVPLLNDAMAGGVGNCVTLLGDVKQSIYGWRGGNWRLLGGDLCNDIYDQELIAPLDKLTTNWRSEPHVVDFNNQFMAAFVERLNMSLNDKLESGRAEGFVGNDYYDRNKDMVKDAYNDLYQNVSPRAVEGQGYVAVDCYEAGEGYNLEAMMQRIESAQLRGYKASDIAILVRSQAQASAVASHIISYRSDASRCKEGCVYDFVSQQALKLSSSDSVNLIISALKASQFSDLNEGDVHTLMFNSLFHGEYVASLNSEDHIFLSSLKRYSLLEGFEKLITYLKLDEDVTIVAYLQALHERIVSFSRENSVDVALFLEWWDGEGKESVIYMPQSGNSMLIATVHLSKGLEFGVVIVPYARLKLDPQTESLIWVESKHAPFDMLGRVTVRYNAALGRSYFAENYYDCTLMTNIENTNTLYVALTRSREELHLMFESKGNAKEDIYDLTLKQLVKEGVVKEVEAEANSLRAYRKGSLRSISSNGKQLESLLQFTGYKSIDYSQRLKIRASTRRYYIEESGETLSPRHYGVIMHKLFERINSSDEVAAALGDMVSEGVISNDDMQSAMKAISLAFENPIINDWFDSRWQVRAENDILMPLGSGGALVTYRPDRVLICGDEAVVIDYKFGMQSVKHKKQVDNYKLVLENMGYSNIKGYVWYVLQNEIVKV